MARFAHTIALQHSTPDQIARFVLLSKRESLVNLCSPRVRNEHTAEVRLVYMSYHCRSVDADNAGTVESTLSGRVPVSDSRRYLQCTEGEYEGQLEFSDGRQLQLPHDWQR